MDEPFYSRNKYMLGVCQLYNPCIHGENDTEIYCHYIYLFELSNIIRYNHSRQMRHYHQSIYSYYRNIAYLSHPYIRNYVNIMIHRYFVNADILEIINIIDTDGYIIYCCIKKTIWLRLIQRKWKNIIKKRKDVLEKRKMICNLYCREINGKLPESCMSYPTLRGMLNGLLTQ